MVMPLKPYSSACVPFRGIYAKMNFFSYTLTVG